MLLFSVRPQHEAAVGMHASPPFWTSLPSPAPSQPSALPRLCGLLSVNRLHTHREPFPFSLPARQVPLLALAPGYTLVAQMVKHLPTMRETWVQSLGQEDLLEKEMATHSSILAWEIPWTEEPLAIVHGVTKSRTWLSNWTMTTVLNKYSKSGHLNLFLISKGKHLVFHHIIHFS